MPERAYNPGVHATLVNATRLGLSRRACAGMAGVGVRAVYRWLERGHTAVDAQDAGEECLAEDADYAQLYRDVEKALAEREAELLLEMDGEEKVGMWMRTAWKLERRDPESWGPPATRMVVQGEIEHKHTQELPAETQLALLEVFHKMVAPKELESGDGDS